MKLFKNIDERIEEYGYKKYCEDEYGAYYSRPYLDGIHNVVILRKKSGEHILQSYDETLMDTKKIGNTNVGLTYDELQLFMKKFKKMKKGWNKKNVGQALMEKVKKNDYHNCRKNHV